MATHIRSTQFTFQNLTIGEHSLRTPYRQRTEETKIALHWGQRKLLLSEIEFFTLYWDPKEIPNPLCVYAGAAPGTHITLLSEMFPAFTFHLYDPAKFDIAESDKIKLFNDYFTDDVAARYAKRNDIFLISDIRTADYKFIQREYLAKRGITNFDADGAPIGPFDLVKGAFKEAELKNEDQIWGDMGMQQNWVLIMNPEHALLKFRPPYAIEGLDRIVQYLKGIVYWQIWPPQTSTETRLKPIRNVDGVYELANWSIMEYEQWCFHHNTMDREQTVYKNIFTDTNDPIDYPELLNDYDSVAEAMVLKLYFEKMGITELNALYDKVKAFSRLITWALNHYNIDETGAKTLAKKRASPVKSSSKAALDAFRAKRRGQAPKIPTAFPHTKVVVSPGWRQPATAIVPKMSPKIAKVEPTKLPSPGQVPLKEPETQPAKSPITTGIVPVTIPEKQPAKSPIKIPTGIVPITIPEKQPAKSPITIPTGIVPITIPGKQPAKSPVTIPTGTISVKVPEVQPTRTPPIIPKPITSPVTVPGAKITVPPVTVPPVTVPPVTVPGAKTTVPPVAVPGARTTASPITIPEAKPIVLPGTATRTTASPVIVPGARTTASPITVAVAKPKTLGALPQLPAISPTTKLVVPPITKGVPQVPQ